MDYSKAKQYSDTVVSRLARKRRERGLSIYRLAELTGLSKEAIRKVELGINTPTLVTVILICEALEVSLEQVVREE